MTYSRTWRLTRLTLLSLLGSSVVSAQSSSTTSAFSAAASSTASSTSSLPITHTVNVAQVCLECPRACPQSSSGPLLTSLQIGRLHVCSRRHISRSRGLYRYVFAGATGVLSCLLTVVHYQNTNSTQRTIALS